MTSMSDMSLTTFSLVYCQGCHSAIKEKASDELAVLAVIAGVITLVEVGCSLELFGINWPRKIN